MGLSDPLTSLLLDADTLDRNRIASVLQDVLGIDKGSGRVHPLPGYSKLKSRQKVLAVLLGKKVSVLLGIMEDESMAHKGVVSESGLAPGTVAPTLKALRDDRRVSQMDKGQYYLSPHQVTLALQELEGSVVSKAEVVSSDGPAQNVSSGPNAERSEPLVKRSRRTGVEIPRTQKGTRRKQPKSVVKQLISDGFFSQYRSLKDISNEISGKTATLIPTTSLSPLMVRLLRAGEVVRKRNDKGRWVYRNAN